MSLYDLFVVKYCYRCRLTVKIRDFYRRFDGVNMEGGSADAYTWDAPSHVIESIDDFVLDPQDNADQWFGKAF